MLVSLGFASGCALESGAGDASEEMVDGAQELRRHRPDFQILGPGGTIRGKTYEQWAGNWWRWLYSIPVSTNPALDTTGEFCHEGQQGPVFNLAGTFGGAATRTCTISHGKPVFFPIVTTQADNCGVPPENQLSVAELIEYQSHFPETVTAVSLEVDGTLIGDEQAELEPFLIDVSRFSYNVPEEDSLYELQGLDFSGRCSPSFVAGYFVMLSFDRGEHTLRFSGALNNGFALESTYQLTVR
jgi:hypothetical protein